MAYNNNYNSNRGGNGGRQNWGNSNGYQGGNGGGYRQGGYNQQQRQTKKHSGAKYGVDTNGNPYVSAWKYTRRDGLVKFFARPYKGTQEHLSKTGRAWHNWFVTVTEGYNTTNKSGLFDPLTQRVIIKELGMVINPKAPNRGYCGTFTRRN